MPCVFKRATTGRPYKNNKTLSLPVGAIIDRPQCCLLYLSATRQILIIVCRAGVYSRRNVVRSIFLLRTNKRSPINPIINGVSLPLIIMLLYTKPPVPKSVRAVACKTKTTRSCGFRYTKRVRTAPFVLFSFYYHIRSLFFGRICFVGSLYVLAQRIGIHEYRHKKSQRNSQHRSP